MDELLQLYPSPARAMPLRGQYLSLNLHRQAVVNDVLIYANYIASLDGRISLRSMLSGEYEVPAAIANSRDWRLYQELAAQSEIMITSARYFRQLAKGCAQDLLPVGCGKDFEDLRLWRIEQGLMPQPDVLILSVTLDIPVSALEQLHGRRIVVLTSEYAEADRIKKLEQAGVEVIKAGVVGVDGSLLRNWLIAERYRSAYMIAGPEVCRTLIAAKALDQLFLTTQLSLVGGDQFHTLLSGEIGAPVSLRLIRLLFDQYEGGSQLFAQYALRDFV